MARLENRSLECTEIVHLALKSAFKGSLLENCGLQSIEILQSGNELMSGTGKMDN